MIAKKAKWTLNSPLSLPWLGSSIFHENKHKNKWIQSSMGMEAVSPMKYGSFDLVTAYHLNIVLQSSLILNHDQINILQEEWPIRSVQPLSNTPPPLLHPSFLYSRIQFGSKVKNIFRKHSRRFPGRQIPGGEPGKHILRRNQVIG